jgi:hypothetical protein
VPGSEEDVLVDGYDVKDLVGKCTIYLESLSTLGFYPFSVHVRLVFEKIRGFELFKWLAAELQ